MFVDSGLVGPPISTSELRASTGMALLWVSPMGPLKISVAKAFRSDPSDRLQTFQFTIGGTF